MRLYNGRKVRHWPAGPPLSALRLYTVRWALRPGLQGSESPQERILIVQVTEDEAQR
jgi:hypothetical protein